MSAHDFGALCLFCFREAGDGVTAEADADAVRADLADLVAGMRRRHRTSRAAFIGSAADLARLAHLEGLLEAVVTMDDDDSIWGQLCERCENCNGCEWRDGEVGGELCERCAFDREAREARREVKP